MANTRITQGVIKPNEDYDTRHINSTGIVTTTGLDVNGNADISGSLNIGGVLTYEDVTNVDSVGLITARKGIISSGVVTATAFHGSGASLTGIDATALKDPAGNVKIQAQASGAVHTGVSTFSGNINLPDSVSAVFGTDSDGSIKHTGTNLQIFETTGNIQVTNYANDKDVDIKTDDGSGGIPGVNVILKGSTTGTTTDLDGNYRLSVPEEGGTLEFSFIGLSTQEIVIGARSVIDITMSEDVETLGEVVVTALGVEREKKALGYAVSNLSSSEITKRSEPDAIRSLTGKIAGVNIQGGGGAPGQSTKINIRGYSSMTGNTQPLFVVDGVPFDNSVQSTDDFSQNTVFSNRAFDIDPNNIKYLTDIVREFNQNEQLKKAALESFGVDTFNDDGLITFLIFFSPVNFGTTLSSFGF